jgi:thioesterase domain-containing protein
LTDIDTTLRGLSATKRLALRRLLAEQDMGTAVLEMTGSNLKVLRGEGTRRLFIFPATEGSVGYMNGYLPHIPADWGVYGCQTPGLDGEQDPYHTVEELAEHSVREIRLVQPEGPYYLAGNCMGGLPAFEAAQQLQAAGAEVALVLHLMPTFDRPWLDLPGGEALRVRALFDYAFIMERLLGTHLDLPVDELTALPDAQRPEALVQFLSTQDGLSDVDIEVLRHRVTVYQANLGAMFAYQPDGAGFDGTLEILAVGETSRGEDVVDPNSPYAAALRAMDPARVAITRVDAEASALFDCAEPHMSLIGEKLQHLLNSL